MLFDVLGCFAVKNQFSGLNKPYPDSTVFLTAVTLPECSSNHVVVIRGLIRGAVANEINKQKQ